MNMHRLAMTIIVPLVAAMLYACATNSGVDDSKARETTATSILLFGDTGYDYAWLGEDDYEDAFTAREFIIDELDDWIEDKRPIEDFRIPPMHYAEQTGGYVMASGLWPVSTAVRNWCAPEDRCEFAVMLGDNIYPAGATLGQDGRDDNRRFDELLLQPYKGLQEQDPNFVIYPVLGNHDWETSREGALLQVAYLQQSPLFHMGGIFYRVQATPDIEIFAIDTTVLLAGETVYADALADDGSPVKSGVVEAEVPWASPQGDEANMVAWLEQALADSDARWKLVIGHHPLWSSSGSKQEEAIVLRRLLTPVLCRYADAYVVGHDHTLEVHSDDCREAGEGYRDIPPLLQIVSGAAGKQRPLHTPFMAWQDKTYPQKTTHFAEGLIWGFAELVLAGDSANVSVVATPPADGDELAAKYTHRFARRSDRSPEINE